MFQGMRVPTPCRMRVRYIRFHLSTGGFISSCNLSNLSTLRLCLMAGSPPACCWSTWLAWSQVEDIVVDIVVDNSRGRITSLSM